jgi:hypothetical protein
MTSHRRVLLRGTARLPTRCASPFRRKKKTHCSISLDRFLWEEERKICATCKCNESCILRSAHVGVYGKQSTGVVKHIQHIILSCHCDVFQTFRIIILFRAARAVHDVYTCELTNQPFRLCTPSHSFTVSMPRSRRYSDTASDVKAGKRGNGNEDCHFGHPPYHTQVPIPSPENSCMLGHGSHALFLSLGPASYEHKVYLQNVSRAWRGGV